MDRRGFLASGLGLASAPLLAPGALAASVNAPGAPPRRAAAGIAQSVCQWCFKGMSVEALAVGAKRIGLASVELVQPSDFPILQKHGLVCAMAWGPPEGGKGWNRLEHHDVLVAGFEERIRGAARAGYPNVIAFSGSRDGLDDEQGLEHCVTGLRRIVPVAERERVTICLELLNSKVDHKGYMADRTAWGVELVKRVGSDRFKLLYDIYHMQIMEGDVIRTIRENHQYIGHYHTAGNPGRHEIDETQELNYPAIVRAIRETGYRGFLGQEFVPTRDPLTSLAQAYRICDV